MGKDLGRRSLLQGLAAALAVSPELLAQNAPSGSGVRIEQGHDRFDQDARTTISRYQVKVSGTDSGKQLLIYEFSVTEKGGPPVHIHRNEDEWLYILQGDFVAESEQPSTAAISSHGNSVARAQISTIFGRCPLTLSSRR